MSNKITPIGFSVETFTPKSEEIRAQMKVNKTAIFFKYMYKVNFIKAGLIFYPSVTQY